MAAVALIFDLDGTVWDSAIWFARALADGDQTVEHGYRAELAGAGNIVQILRRENFSRDRVIRRAAEISGPPPLFAGMADVIESLRLSGVPLGVATSLPGSIALPMLALAGLETTFATIIHAGLCRAPKPSPASINMALRELEIAPGPNVFYVGDRASDAEAARRAGVAFSWVAHGYETPPADCGLNPVCPEDLLEL